MLETPFLAVGVNYDWGFLFSRVITEINTEETLIAYMKREAGTDLHGILIIKNDQVIKDITPEDEQHKGSN